MKYLAVLFVAVVIVGWASPLLASTPDLQVFEVTVYEDGSVRDTGLILFLPEDQHGYRHLWTYWYGKGLWKEEGYWEEVRDYGDWGCSWDGWYSASIPAPYDDFEGGYYTPWGDPSRSIVYGTVEPLNQETDLWFFGEVY